MNILEPKEIESFPNFKRKKRRSSVKEFENIREREFIEDILQTPYEKVLKILGKIMKFLFDSKAEEKMIQELEWVIKKIETNSLYGFEICEQSIKKNNFNSDNLKTFLEYLNIYCEMPNTEQSPKLFKSHIVKNMSDIEMLHRPQKKNSSSNLQKTYIDSFDDNNDNIINKEFDIFEYEKTVGRSNVLPSIALIAIKNTKTIDLINCLNISSFLEKIRSGYKESNPYHNDLHAADVCQTVLFYLTNNNNELTIISHFKKIDLMSLIIAALIHDLGHPGVTNNYLINTGNNLANTYNDKSVLENFHVAEGFRIMNSFNILSRLDTRQFKKLRKRVIESVLATDLISHAKVYSLMKNKVKGCETIQISSLDNTKLLIDSNSSNLFEEQQDIINFILHTADISHSSKSFSITSKWTNHIMDEFWLQGDKEKVKGLQVSFLCDRETSDVPRSQIAFIQGIVLPSFDIFSQAVPSLYFLKENILKNLEEWKKAVNVH